MSRIGIKSIPIPDNVTIDISGNHSVEVKGPKGTLVQKMHPIVQLNIENNQLSVSTNASTPKSKAMRGLFRMLLYNMVVGVTTGHKKSLEIIGIGYNAQVQNKILKLSLGKSHLTYVKLPPEIEAEVETIKKGKTPITYIHFSGADKELIGNVAAQVRRQKPPEPYISKRDSKSKGIRYTNELYIGKVQKNV